MSDHHKNDTPWMAVGPGVSVEGVAVVAGRSWGGWPLLVTSDGRYWVPGGLLGPEEYMEIAHPEGMDFYRENRVKTTKTPLENPP